MTSAVKNILKEDDLRMAKINAVFNPYTGEGSVGERFTFGLQDFSMPIQFLPVDMFKEPLIQTLCKYKSIKAYVLDEYKKAKVPKPTEEMMEAEIGKVSRSIIRIRIRHDFPFWAAFLVKIKAKGGGADIFFRLNRPQLTKLIPSLEEERRAGKPIRLILLKARQWGGSTCIQMYMAWLQLVHSVGLNSLIVGHVGATSAEVEDMFKNMLADYPPELLYDEGQEFDAKETKWEGVGNKPNIHRVPQRHCKIKTGSAEVPDSARGGDYNLVHCTEVGLWKKTEGKKPEDIMQSATKGILLEAMTMIVMESTAKGVGNYFHREYVAAKEGISQYKALFVAWFEIDQYRMRFEAKAQAEPAKAEQRAGQGATGAGQRAGLGATGAGQRAGRPGAKAERGANKPGGESEEMKKWRMLQEKRRRNNPVYREEFAEWLWNNRENSSAVDERHESGQYLWWLWEQGACLEAIHWYIAEREGTSESGVMKSEYPSDDVEAFVNSGANVFDRELVERFRKACKVPRWTGELEGQVPLGSQGMTNGTADTRRGIGTGALLDNLRFVEDSQGCLQVWNKPEKDEDGEKILNRYLVVVDVGGRGTKADWSVICVFDRVAMLEGGKPAVVAQWYGHIDMDLLAWKAAQIAKWYNNALLVIESNTLETKDRDRMVDGDQTEFILLQLKESYDNLYARKQSEEQIKQGAPARYGFHTNVSTKPMIINVLISAVREHAYTERDGGCLDEFCYYEKKQNNSYGAVIGKHDDKLMTRAIGLYICFFDMEMPKIISSDRKITFGAKKIVKKKI